MSDDMRPIGMDCYVMIMRIARPLIGIIIHGNEVYLHPKKVTQTKEDMPWLTLNIIHHIRKPNIAFMAAKKFAKPEKSSRSRNYVIQL